MVNVAIVSERDALMSQRIDTQLRSESDTDLFFPPKLHCASCFHSKLWKTIDSQSGYFENRIRISVFTSFLSIE